MKAITVVLLLTLAGFAASVGDRSAKCTRVEGNVWDCIVFVQADAGKQKCTDIRVTARTKKKAKKKAVRRAICTELPGEK